MRLVDATSPPLRGEWIEMAPSINCREIGASLPLRGEWIEMVWKHRRPDTLLSLSLCGESGLKSLKEVGKQYDAVGLSLCGESGMK